MELIQFDTHSADEVGYSFRKQSSWRESLEVIHFVGSIVRNFCS